MISQTRKKYILIPQSNRRFTQTQGLKTKIYDIQEDNSLENENYEKITSFNPENNNFLNSNKPKMKRVISEGGEMVQTKRFEDVDPNFAFKMNNENEMRNSIIKEMKTNSNKNIKKTKEFVLKKLTQCPSPGDYEIVLLKNIVNKKSINDKMIESKNQFFKLENSNIFYEGDLRFGRLEGNGTLMLDMIDQNTATQSQIKNNLLYKGEFLNNRVHGKGTLFFKDDYRFEGNFNEGIANGYGILYRTNKIIKEGVWINGKIN